jgi:hypothetical protein
MRPGNFPRDARVLSPDVIDAIANLGSSALFVIALWAFVTGKVRRESEFRDARTEGESRLAELRADRDEWKAIANSSLAKMDRLTDVVEAISGKARA